LAWFFTLISSPILAKVINCDTSHKMWQELQQSHTSHSLAKTLALKLLLQTSKKGGLSCSQFLQHIQSLADRLRSIGSDISDQDLILYTLQGLGSDFENFVTAISLWHQPFTMSELQSFLLVHEARLVANIRSIPSQSALLTTPKPDTLASLSFSQSSSQPGSDSLALYTGATHNTSFPGGSTSHTNRGRSNYNSNRGHYNRG
jgi:gag-polypeptide of LTR copia-type